MKSESFQKAIWTDNERTRFLIWEAYEGFIENYENYMMYSSMQTKNPLIRLGLIRYSNRFYEEVRLLLDSFKDQIGEKKVLAIHLLFESEKNFNKKDFVFMRRLFAEFMHYSGLSNILMIKDNRSNYERAAEKYHQ